MVLILFSVIVLYQKQQRGATELMHALSPSRDLPMQNQRAQQTVHQPREQEQQSGYQTSASLLFGRLPERASCNSYPAEYAGDVPMPYASGILYQIALPAPCKAGAFPRRLMVY
jgi:hypothetical protein